MNCPHCGGEVSEQAKVCGHGGRWLVAEPSTPPPATVAPSKRGLPGWVWGLVGVVVVVALVGALLATGVIRLPGQQAVALITPTPVLVSTLPPLSTLPVAAPSATETPTPPPPTATLRPTSIPTPSVLVYDDFSNPTSGWPVFGDRKNGEVGYGDDVFRIAFYEPGGFHAAWSPEQYSDFVVETSFSTPDSVADVGGGLTLRTLGTGWYLLWIYPVTGEYTFLKGNYNTQTELAERTHSPAIQPTHENGRLHIQLKVEACGDAFTIWVASPGGTYQYVDTVRDSELRKGHLGPSADSPKTAFSAPVEILFDWIRVAP